MDEQRYILVPLELTGHTEWGIMDKVGEPFGCGYHYFSNNVDAGGARKWVFFLRDKQKVIDILNGLNERHNARVATERPTNEAV